MSLCVFVLGTCCFCVPSCFSFFFFFKQKTAYEMRISDWSSDVCASDLLEYRTPFELLIAVMLSAQATDVSVNKATRRLYPVANRSEERRVGKECVSTCRSRW